MNIFVGNLSFDTTETELKQLFETMGNVTSAIIVMEKEKKAPKSRGFGFVEMPDQAQALAAIAALNGKEFMGRLLNVNPTRPKTETQRQSELNPVRNIESIGEKNKISNGVKKRVFLKAKAKIRVQANQYQPFIPKPGTYKGGRRTRSYVMRTGSIEMQEGTKPWQKSQENPMRWRKRQSQAKPWQKSTSEHKPWQKPESGTEAKPWKRVSAESRPWKKPAGDSKPWQKRIGERPQGSRFKAGGSRASRAKGNVK